MSVRARATNRTDRRRDFVAFWGNELGSREVVHRRDLVGDHGGEAPGSFPDVWRSGGDRHHEGPCDGPCARVWIRSLCRPSRGGSSGDGEAYHRWQNGKERIPMSPML